ncbi:MAG TPA: MlaD family protein [Thermoanaerobaculia bacterium]|nr:MlaD family protein [Thermoanaerobaculia bacterium]
MSQVVKVGIFATVCLVILAVLIWKIEDINPFAEEGQRIDAVFDSVAGLDDKASVRIAGVRVGRVDNVGLDQGGRKARVTLLLEQPVELPQGTFARVANLGLLGEKYIEIVPGPPGGPPLPDNAVLQGVTPPTIDEAIAKINEIGTSIQDMTGSIGGAGLGGNISRLVDEMELTSREIRLLVAENRASLNATIGNFREASSSLARELPRLADQMNRTLVQIEALVADNRGDVSASLGNIREVTDRLQTSVDNFNQISGKIARGEGTLGKLVNDEQAYDEVISTLDSIQGGVETLSGTLGAINRFRIDLDLQGFNLPDVDDGSWQTALLLDIDPQDNQRLYRAGITSPPRGKRQDKTEIITVTNPDGTTEVTTVNKVTLEQSYSATGLFGYKAPGNLRLFAGLIENSGGAQIEYPLFKDRFLVSFEAFDFNRPAELSPHLRLMARWKLHPNLYLLGGYDDFLEDQSVFLGGGIRWNDENIKYLLGAVPLR